MATFKICVFKHQKRKDDKYPVSIRVYWKGEYSYIKTEYFVTEKQIHKKSFTLKDVYIINDLNKRIEKFEDLKHQKLGLRINMYSAKDLARYFDEETKPGADSGVDFIKFSRMYIERLKSRNRTATAGNLNRTINGVVDFCNGRENIPITDITFKFLNDFEAYLRSDRTMKRKNQFGDVVTIHREGLSDVSVFNYMTDLRVLFNAAMDEYNDEDRDEIKIIHYPFRKYKIKPRPENKKRNLSADQIISIRDVSDSDLNLDRAIIARDVFMLSFYLLGMNLSDMYDLKPQKTGRISYNRKKTKGRRHDNAFISIRIEPEAECLIEKYRDKTGKRMFDFYTRYTTSHIFSSNVNIGLKRIAEVCKIDVQLSAYYARHSFATIARNKCDVSKDDIDLALNHVDQTKRMADVYIEKDWSRVDNVARKVLDFINSVQ